ncbi:restriction endonuclease subunit S [Phormidium tenue]|uniref:Restriction endonuclease subunit S n=1 Tax=Phormidium tenue FACHB-1050 TaxID=2692857 RepID=A0ABR8CDL5_9CYAN|nr:restriction endonuclease subunit S [Phormidium tenue]MBD2318686.1 restriction endonuclease subunit S [Phormidium tenue FACHB-1050]
MINIPLGWSTATISDITEYISRGKQPKYTNYSTLPVINQRAIRWTGIQNEYLKYVDPLQFDLWEPEKFIQVGDILWNSTGTGTLGRAYLVTERDLEPPKVVDSHVTILRPNKTAIDPRYLFFWIQSSEVQDNIVSFATGATNQIELSRAVIASISIPIAPLSEQKRIVDKLDSLLARVDACRDRLNRVSVIIKNFRQAVLTAATSGKLTEVWRNDNKNTDLDDDIDEELTKFSFVDEHCFGDFRFPSSWNISPLGGISEIVGGITKDSKKQDPAYEELPYLRVANVQRGFLDLKEIKTIRVPQQRVERFLLKRGDILFNEGGDIDKLGRGWVWNEEIERCTFQNHVFRVRLHDESFEPKFFSWYGNLRGADYFLSVGKQTTNLASINKSLLSALPVVIPPVAEQQEIVRRVDELFAYADLIESRYQEALLKVEQLVPVILNKAFRGELVPQDPDEESVSDLLARIRHEKVRIDFEKKNIPIVRRSTKANRKVLMKHLSDYSSALNSAFSNLENQVDARQLFDQAGFNSEEVVQFYEGIRSIPKLLIAFRKTRQENSPQERVAKAKSIDKDISKQGRFRLLELWLEDFKNLTDYTVRFDPSHGIDVVLGWNGTGKSNLFEALVIIFRDLHKWWEKNQWTDKPMKGYRLRYLINEKIIEILWQPQEMKRPKLRVVTFKDGIEELDKFQNLTRDKLPLPRFIFGYYSGPTNRLAEHFLPMKQDHYNRLRDATSDDPTTLANLLEKRRFFCAENHHAKYVLLAFFHKEDPAINQFLEDRLRIVGFESALFVIRKPRWAKKGQSAEDFWGARGVMRRVMERLRQFAIAPMVVEQTVSEGYNSRREDHYYFFLPDLQSLHAFAAEYQDARTFFIALESTDFSELIYDVKIQVRVQSTKTEQVAITFHELSEGEQQLLMVLGLMRFTKSHQSLVLLDEPDTHLNPHWSVDYLKLLTRVMSESNSDSEEQQTSQILMSTHDPLVIASLLKEQIHLLKRDWQTGICKWEQPTVNPRGLGFTGILTSEMFGMRSDLDEETLADLDTKVRIVAKEDNLTPEDVLELEEINKRLEDAGFQKAFSDPYYAAFIKAWGQRHRDFMAGVQFVNPEQQQEIDRIARQVLEEVLAELQSEGVN